MPRGSRPGPASRWRSGSGSSPPRSRTCCSGRPAGLAPATVSTLTLAEPLTAGILGVAVLGETPPGAGSGLRVLAGRHRRARHLGRPSGAAARRGLSGARPAARPASPSRCRRPALAWGMDVILIPGFWLDASSWGGSPALEEAGHRVQSAHAARPRVGRRRPLGHRPARPHRRGRRDRRRRTPPMRRSCSWGTPVAARSRTASPTPGPTASRASSTSTPGRSATALDQRRAARWSTARSRSRLVGVRRRRPRRPRRRAARRVPGALHPRARGRRLRPDRARRRAPLRRADHDHRVGVPELGTRRVDRRRLAVHARARAGEARRVRRPAHRPLAAVHEARAAGTGDRRGARLHRSRRDPGRRWASARPRHDAGRARNSTMAAVIPIARVLVARRRHSVAGLRPVVAEGGVVGTLEQHGRRVVGKERRRPATFVGRGESVVLPDEREHAEARVREVVRAVAAEEHDARRPRGRCGILPPPPAGRRARRRASVRPRTTPTRRGHPAVNAASGRVSKNARFSVGSVMTTVAPDSATMPLSFQRYAAGSTRAPGMNTRPTLAAALGGSIDERPVGVPDRHVGIGARPRARRGARPPSPCAPRRGTHDARARARRPTRERDPRPITAPGGHSWETEKVSQAPAPCWKPPGTSAAAARSCHA